MIVVCEGYRDVHGVVRIRSVMGSAPWVYNSDNGCACGMFEM